MPGFKSREEYEAWKAARMKGLKEPQEIQESRQGQVQSQRTEQEQGPIPPGSSEGNSSPPMAMAKPEATGEAAIVRDGVRETFVLKTGFFSKTRLDDPRKAKIHFQIPAADDRGSNARRIELRLDATQAGRHFVDGDLVSKSWMDQAPINIGEETPKGRIASFYFIADGGQVFFPKENCTMTVTSPYTGSPDSTFAGEISECVVHSAGID